LADNAVDTAEIADNAVTLAKMAGLARGKLIYGDASGDPAALAVGGADEVLTHDGTDLAWAAASGGGKILQVVYNVEVLGSSVTDNSDAWVTTGIDLDITPSSTSSKIYLTWNHIFFHPAANNNEIRMTFFRDATQLGDCIIHQTNSWIPSAMGYVDEPSSVSQINYEAYFKGNQGATVYGGSSGFNAVLTAWEIDGS
jgi:hypothetical protein